MRTLYLHIGRGKTGTTAIQRYCATQRDALLAAGVDYLMTGDMGRGHGHQSLAKGFIADVPGYMIPANNPEQVRTDTAAEIAASAAPNILLSSENFPLADIARVRDWIGTLPDIAAVKVIFFVRSQDELAESEYNQMVKLKGEARSLADYAAALEGADYMHESRGWAEAFGAENLICRVFDASGGVLTGFLECLPVDPAALPEPTRGNPTDAAAYANKSLGAKALGTALLLNRIEIAERLSLYRDLFARFEGQDIPAVLMSSAEARALRARFAASNAAFSETYLGTRCEDLGGRRYDDATRDALFAQVKALNIAP
ncbi:hypothetical protein ACN2XU_08990 [Primorskyibacter sp. 2E107]|uniref:hypothetical protein n=1 Tax=Primorskyibacter sp. 2E107 TaxID=3403458 RepID=UPI003AF68D8C